MKTFAAISCCLLLLSGCTSDADPLDEVAVGPDGMTAPADDSAEAAIRFVMEGLKAGQPVIVWNALPPQQQNDINEIVQIFAATMDESVWNQGAEMIRGLQNLLENKAEFFANFPPIASAPNGSATKEAIPKLAALLKTILDGAGDLEALQSFDGQDFTATTGASLFAQLESLGALAPNSGVNGNPFAAWTEMEIETVDATEKSATLKLISPDGRSELQNFMKDDGKWVPMNMVQNWDENVKNLKDKIKTMPDNMATTRMQVMGASGAVNGMLAALNNAQTQEEFDGVLNAVVGQVGMMVGGLMGGPPPGTSASPGQTGSMEDSSSAPQE